MFSINAAPVDACMPVPCSKCSKTTWAGCGNHIVQVMSQVPEAERCTCPRD
ncbi:hypothetical protein BDZ90DRAFT_260026 [Jaminaea rosea]|uniref:Uncharacterized protein n=1 Tax=Jaminaea rosea TaxID=1569628 RepID=A0A316UTT0_9BASI|nr:hypothetical protein BDZ90DRAFT_260026 [Jaminaea rosea]PWN28208.1 hypothetical protein BDZ90DRAFT_260026 [Jaminaea rosea]